ncbi:phosphohistidine phosphatase SixA [Kushneria pakistanensis]|uniref:Phosphohistidine phosphatase SixA n=1 Tax=Kushneria pakistanensis TaxID=1508770 RepID=A0ABQ3FCS4_9GAMM|nr:phosphohistidine phosphatase SixA [Kushneria pakistanensis]GHC18393.1 phosphohistidine phosphatase SixA [Kushneria pakistanensis]
MKIYVMRHGEAASGTPDAHRPLDTTGQKEVASIADWFVSQLGDRGRQLRIVASPYDRAQQSASIIARALQVDDIMTLPIMTPDVPPQTLIEWLTHNVDPQHDDTPWLFVSHMPLVAELVGQLVDGGPNARLPMGTADVIELDAQVWAAGCATLVRHVTPATAALDNGA